MTITNFLATLDRAIPLSAGMEGDPVGLQVFRSDREVSRIGIAYEIDHDVIAQAIEQSVELIVAYHPLIYSPLTRLIGAGRVDRSVQELIRSDIALYVLHTALDAHPRGSNGWLAIELGLTEIAPLMKGDSADETFGMGRIGLLPAPLPFTQFLDRVRDVCGSRSLRFSMSGREGPDRNVQRIALVAGSGMSFYMKACEKGADLFLTGDAKYHDFHAANDGISIIDAGHAETERFVMKSMIELVSDALTQSSDDVAVVALTPSDSPIGYAA